MDRPDHIHITIDVTPGPLVVGTPDDEVWLPILGPTATCLAAFLVRNTVGWQTFTAQHLAADVGVNVYQLWRTLDRLAGFGAGQFMSTDVFAVRAYRRALPERFAARIEAAKNAESHPATTVSNSRTGSPAEGEQS